MKLTLVDDRVYDAEGNEKLELTSAEQDYLIAQLYPQVPTIAELSRHRSSWGGIHCIDIDRFIHYSAPYVDSDDCAMPELMDWWGSQFGGRDGARRLRTLYCNKFHLYAAANDLGLTYDALVKWFQRWRTKALSAGLTPERLFNR